MTIGRSYKSKMSMEDAINELKRCSGEQFDPELVDKFIQVLTEENLKKNIKIEIIKKR